MCQSDCFGVEGWWLRCEVVGYAWRSALLVLQKIVNRESPFDAVGASAEVSTFNWRLSQPPNKQAGHEEHDRKARRKQFLLFNFVRFVPFVLIDFQRIKRRIRYPEKHRTAPEGEVTSFLFTIFY